MDIEQESVIVKLYESVEQEQNTSKEYKELLSKFNVVHEQFNETMTTEQQEKLSELLTIRNDMEDAETKDYFIKGFKIAIRLMTEALYDNEE